MNDKPNAAELLDIARQTLLELLLPELPPTSKYHALMVANAMGIAGREISASEVDLGRELEPFAALYPSDGEETGGVSPAERLLELNIRLSREIRQGGLDADRAGLIYALLQAQTRRRLAISNPKYLEGWGK